MPWREVRDPETGELVIRFDPETDAIEYRRRDRKVCVERLEPYRDAVKAVKQGGSQRLTPRRRLG